MAVTNHNICIIKLRSGHGYIFIAFAFKEFINTENNYFVIDFEQPELLFMTFQHRMTHKDRMKARVTVFDEVSRQRANYFIFVMLTSFFQCWVS
jgi:hypothetical protein